jgi:hypothetical protein
MRGHGSVSATITAENTFTDPILIHENERYTLSISGSFTATVTHQRRLDGINWRDVEPFTIPAEKDGIAPEAQEVRVGVKTGDFTSGPIVVRIGKA